ncbi:linear amide C-N hydrolase [Paenibacillaceae sp. P-4]|uniref:linear amide C-N hydrolase n=1 Tax=Paenibacillaceae bacterium P-4 TaxID=3160969 RepID=UPI0032E842A8
MCTNISIPRKSKKGGIVSARTMDWTLKLNSIVNFVPRGQSFPEANLPGDEMKWKNKYGFVGAGDPIEDFIFYSDGLNEHGLSVAGLWLSCSKYPMPRPGAPILYNSNFVPYLLGNYKNTHEVKAALADLTVINISELYPSAYALLHYIISDASGNHLIVEFTEGEMKIYPSKLGVLTNEPTYPWHLVNQELYQHLSLENNAQTSCGSELYGSGQLGIPGDPTPQSRFARSAFLQKTTFRPANTKQSIGLARQILQTLTVPSGTVYNMGSSTIYDWTQWCVYRDHTNRSYYFNTDFNSKLYGIHLTQLNLDASEQSRIQIERPAWYEDITKAFNA